jgi:RES domain-containing protein
MPVPLPADRMLPKAELVGDGRINPRGIAYLYLATSTDAAIAEVRPPKAAHVTVADVTLARAVKVVDCRVQRGADPVWAELDFALSLPADRTEPWRTYLPTQAVAEFFRAQNYDGIVYRSSLSEKGYNLALFDPELGRIGTRRLFTIEAIAYAYRPHELFPEAE